jgi:hypothetical protein
MGSKTRAGETVALFRTALLSVLRDSDTAARVALSSFPAEAQGVLVRVSLEPLTDTSLLASMSSPLAEGGVQILRSHLYAPTLALVDPPEPPGDGSGTIKPNGT